MSNMELTALREQLTASDAEIDSLENQLASANQRLAETNQRLAETSQQLTDSQASERSARREIRNLHATGGSRSVSTTQAHSPVSNEAQEAAELRNLVRGLEAQNHSFKLRVEELESSNQSLTIEKKELSRRVDEQAANFDQMASEIGTLKTEKEEDREFLQSWKRVLDAKLNKTEGITGKEDPEFFARGPSSFFGGPRLLSDDHTSREDEGSDSDSSEFYDPEGPGVANDEPLPSENPSEKETGLAGPSSELNDTLSNQMERSGLPDTQERSLPYEQYSRPDSSAGDLRATPRQREGSITPPLQSLPRRPRVTQPGVSRSSSRQSAETKELESSSLLGSSTGRVGGLPVRVPQPAPMAFSPRLLPTKKEVLPEKPKVPGTPSAAESWAEVANTSSRSVGPASEQTKPLQPPQGLKSNVGQEPLRADAPVFEPQRSSASINSPAMTSRKETPTKQALPMGETETNKPTFGDIIPPAGSKTWDPLAEFILRQKQAEQSSSFWNAEPSSDSESEQAPPPPPKQATVKDTTGGKKEIGRAPTATDPVGQSSTTRTKGLVEDVPAPAVTPEKPLTANVQQAIPEVSPAVATQEPESLEPAAATATAAPGSTQNVPASTSNVEGGGPLIHPPSAPTIQEEPRATRTRAVSNPLQVQGSNNALRSQSIQGRGGQANKLPMESKKRPGTEPSNGQPPKRPKTDLHDE